MLSELYIKDFILIDELRINFEDGLNVITGETGAGKSILIKAIDIAMGNRASKDLVRPNSKKAEIELAFHITDEETLNSFQSHYGLDLGDEPFVILKREIFSGGRTISRLNGNIASAETIKSISKNLVDIHGQHEHQSLLRRENYLKLLDRSISGEHMLRADSLAALQTKIKSLRLAIDDLKKSSKKNKREYDFHIFQLKEIENANLVLGEDSDLSIEYEYIKNGESIYTNCLEALSLISSNFDDNGNAMDFLGKAISSIEPIAPFSDDLKNIHSRLIETNYMLEDASSSLRHFYENFTYDSSRLNYIENRLDSINSMKMKYGNTIEEIISYKNELEDKIDEYIHSDGKIESLTELCEKQIEEYHDAAKLVSRERCNASNSLGREILSELHELNLEKASFSIEISTDETRISHNGYDEVDFIISTNPGQAAKSLSKIASGGEISRIMLAIKVILSKIDTIGTVIFDEIDTGVSGITAKKVAEKLYRTSKDAQVVCITHLPQIAVMGDHHMLIEKSTKDNFTTTRVKALAETEKIKEISRLLDGDIDSSISEHHAKGLIETITERKLCISQSIQEDGER